MSNGETVAIAVKEAMSVTEIAMLLIMARRREVTVSV